jgi:hypothetical protein
VPKGFKPEERGWLEETSLGRLHRTIQGGIERDAKAKAERIEEMPSDEFMAQLVAGLEAIERSNADA